MYRVYDNGKSADTSGFPRLLRIKKWENSLFPTFKKAMEYAKLWLDDWESTIPENWDGKPIDYSGYGDIIEIREEN